MMDLQMQNDLLHFFLHCGLEVREVDYHFKVDGFSSSVMRAPAKSSSVETPDAI